MNFVQRLKKHEGFRKKMYTDSVGVPTIGYGFNLETVSLPRPVAELWLAFEIDKKEDALEKFDWYNDTDAVRQEVLLDMAYNLGIAGLLGFKKMIKALENKQYERAGAEMLDSKWARQVGARAVDLAALMRGNNNTGI
jgi:lysozyme